MDVILKSEFIKLLPYSKNRLTCDVKCNSGSIKLFAVAKHWPDRSPKYIVRCSSWDCSETCYGG